MKPHDFWQLFLNALDQLLAFAFVVGTVFAIIYSLVWLNNNC